MSMFVPDALLAARALNIGLESLRPYLKQKNGYKCTAILGTVEGDYHDIGKIWCGSMCLRWRLR